MELLKAVLFGIVEGVTEWLPISSTGHLILLNEFITLNVSDAFRSMFDVVIQLGAILAVIVLFFHKLNPFSPTKSEGEKKQTWQLWFKVIAAIIPSGIVGVLFDDWMEAHFHNATVVSIALIVYGVAFTLVATIVCDYVINGARQTVQFLIISKKYQEIADAINTDVRRGVTLIEGKGWYSKKDVDLLIVLTRKYESQEVFAVIKAIDPDAVVSQTFCQGVFGEGFDKIK